MIWQMQKEYWVLENKERQLRDVSYPMERAAALADTEFKKIYTAAVTDLLKRIFEGDPKFSPNGRFICQSNMFNIYTIAKKDGITDLKPFINPFVWAATSKNSNKINYSSAIISNLEKYGHGHMGNIIFTLRDVKAIN